MPDGWDEKPYRLQQKDLDARWDIKNGVNHYGYKNSICIDAEHGFIRRYTDIPANIHDSQMLPPLLDLKVNMTMSGQIQPTQVSALRICLALVALRVASMKRAHDISRLVTQPKSVIALSRQFRLVVNMYLGG
ncbi:transposase [Cyanobium sp. ULC084]